MLGGNPDKKLLFLTICKLLLYAGDETVYHVCYNKENKPQRSINNSIKRDF